MKRRKRRPRPSDNEELLNLFRGPGECDLCGRWCRNRQACHVRGKGVGGGWRLDNRLNLYAGGGPWDCACHQKDHDGNIERDDVYKAVAKREGLTVEDLKQRLDELQHGKRCECGRRLLPNGNCETCWEIQ